MGGMRRNGCLVWAIFILPFLVIGEKALVELNFRHGKFEYWTQFGYTANLKLWWSLFIEYLGLGFVLCLPESVLLFPVAIYLLLRASAKPSGRLLLQFCFVWLTPWLVALGLVSLYPNGLFHLF